MDPDSTEPTSKKRRLSKASNDNFYDPLEGRGQAHIPSSEKIVERGDPWMDDGTLIIQAGQVQFRVHKSILSQCSSVFMDMFSLPQPQNHEMQPISNATAEGCEVVTVYDSAEDMSHLLKAIYENAYSADPRTKAAPMIFEKSSALLRLGNKYDIPNIRNNMIRRFQAQYPSSLDQMSLTCARYIALDSTDPQRTYFDVINLLYEEGLLSSLPVAFYNAVNKCDTKSIFKYLHDKGAKYPFASSMLSNCIQGKEKLATRMCTVSYTWLKRRHTDISPDCSSRSECKRLFLKLEQRIFNPSPRLSYALGYDSEGFLESVETDEHIFCSTCVEKITELHKVAWGCTFEALPSIWGFESWEELERKDCCHLEDQVDEDL